MSKEGLEMTNAIDGTTTSVDVELDVRGLNCPLPILRTKKALSTMLSGQQIRVRATDPGAAIDFPAFARHSGNALVSVTSDAGVYEFVIKRR